MGVTLLARQSGRRVSLIGAGRRIGAATEQKLDEIEVAVVRGLVERREASLLARIDVGAGGEQGFRETRRELLIEVRDGAVERCHLHFVLRT